MKTLQQVEPRTPISAIPVTISQPGSYYLETNVAFSSGIGILIQTNDVTLDLMGFTVSGTAAALDGIRVNGIRSNIEIRNGVVRECGQDGIDADLADNSRIRDIRALKNGVDGIRGGQFAIIESCMSAENGGDGIQAYQSALLQDCSSSSNGHGFAVGPESRVESCVATFNRTNGIVAAARSTVTDCTASRNGGIGISVADDGTIRACTVAENSFIGIAATNNQCVIENNDVSRCGEGLRVRGFRNIVANNIVKDCTDNYNLARSNSLDLVVSELPESIDWPARIRIPGNLVSSSGLSINSDNVVVDLAGFSLIGSGLGSHGISVPSPVNNLLIRNGVVTRWTLSGIDAGDADNVILEGLVVSDNGYDGATAGRNSSVSRCIFSGNAHDGLFANDGSTVESCSAYQNSRTGLGAGQGAVVRGCTSRDNGGTGISVGGEAVVTLCTSSGNTSNGFLVGFMSIVKDNVATQNSDDGIRVYGEGSRIEGNNVSINSSAGIRAGATDIRNIFIGNTAKANGTDYQIDVNNSIGQILNVGAPSVISNANPWANFRL